MTAAERTRRCRETFELALANGLTMQAASRELTRRRWADADARLAARRCATRAPETARLKELPWWARD